MKVINRKNLPVRSPLMFSIVMWLLLDRLSAAGWVYGVAGTLCAILWVIFFVVLFKEDQVDLFSSNPFRRN